MNKTQDIKQLAFKIGLKVSDLKDIVISHNLHKRGLFTIYSYLNYEGKKFTSFKYSLFDEKFIINFVMAILNEREVF